MATSSVVGDALRLIVTPVQWNPDWDATTCVNSACTGAARPAQVQYLMDLRFLNANVVELSLEVQSLETINHALTTQEFPTMYVAHGGSQPDLPLLLDASGNTIAVDQLANNGFFMKDFTSSAPWVTYQDTAKDYGVGLAMDQGLTGFQGWGGNGSTAPYFHNVRGEISFALPHGGTVRGRTYLALGSQATVAALFSQALSHRPPFGVVDVPAAGSTTSGASVTVAGWVLDSTPIASVSVELDGVASATLPVSSARPDVCAVYPRYAGCPTVGYAGSVSLASLDGCAHLLRVVATDPDGNRSVLGERLVHR